jgi:hypothetical protein
MYYTVLSRAQYYTFITSFRQTVTIQKGTTILKFGTDKQISSLVVESAVEKNRLVISFPNRSSTPGGIL